ncbi:hypothetical protein F2P56_034805 [Juglans regia]|uniref:Protein FAR1-RELATED SEQUENCE n=1 Tax=Juglans regia TaxID=51240 RepID=A0A833WW84_JUGRE|nr:hypothetical protein F2P56_034805 [Juglans regia]
MDKKKDERSPRPSTSIPQAQHPSMPHFGPTMLYPPSSNAEELGQVQNIMLPPSMPHFGPTMLNPSSSNAEESGRVQNIMLPPSIPHFGPTMLYPPSSNSEESARVQNIILPQSIPPLGPTMLNPSSSNAEESGRVQNIMLPPSMPPFGPTMLNPSLSNAEESSRVQNMSNENSSDVCKEGEAEGTNEVSNDGVEEPKPGMEFATDKELMAYYKRYAKQQGFGIITQRTKREADGSAKYLTIGCARGGKYHPSHNNISRPRPTTKTDCKARINAHLVKGVWVMTTVEIAHNHSTVSPQKSRFFRSHKCLDEYSQRMLDLNDRAGIRMNKNFGALVVDAGGFENLDFQEKDCRNFIDKARQLRLGKGGGEALTDYFKRMRLINDGFVSVVDVDEDLRIRNVFWADARSRAAYEYFGDVITFDTTYLTNRYSMPFAPFVGVNHHGQSILLGVGLISSEDTATFVWLFRAWLQCMDDRAPKAIITDQDRAMKSAIALVFPNTRHRYCLWHILRKLLEKLGSHSQFNNGLKTSILSSIYDSQSCAEFEEKWGQLIQKYDLGDNAWLQGLYTERSFWVPAYLRGVFWAGMSTTQRSESMNAFFDGFVHSGTTLKEFVDQFDNALRKKVEIETTADFMSCNQTIPCVSPFQIEKQFQALYTNAKYKEVQKELLGMMCSNCLFLNKEGCISTFDVLDEITIEDDHVKTVKYTVYYNEEECELKCTCALFEMKGILCRHVLKVCQMKKIHSVPEKYVLDRWRKDLKRRYTLVKSSYDDMWQNADARRYELVVKRCLKLATRVSQRDDHRKRGSGQ